MAVRAVLRYPHPSLKQKARPLGEEDTDLTAAVARDLVDTMESFGHCVGLAAPQLDHLVRMMALDVTGHRQATRQNARLVPVRPRI